MHRFSRRLATALGLALLAGASLAPSSASAQSPWTVTLLATMNPQPIGACCSVRLTVVDPATRDTPRKSDGTRMTIADFDLAVTTPDGVSAVGAYSSASFFTVCGCQKGQPGTIATITANYPAAALAPALRAPGVAFATTTTVPLGRPMGGVDPTGCSQLSGNSATVAATALPAASTGTRATPMPLQPAPAPGGIVSTTPPPSAVGGRTGASPPVAVAPAGALPPVGSTAAPPPTPGPPMVNPTGFTMTQTGQTSTQAVVTFAWNAVPGAVRYRVTGTGLPATGLFSTDTTAFFPKIPRGAGSWKVTTLYAGTSATRRRQRVSRSSRASSRLTLNHGSRRTTVRVP